MTNTATEVNYTARRVLEALEVIVFCPSSAPSVSDALGVHPRTARRILQTLVGEQYLERRAGPGRAAHEYQPTVRLLALAAQLAARLPLVAAARHAVRDAEAEMGAAAYVAVPCYSEVLVVAASDASAVRPWERMQASADAAGCVLLAHREAWRSSLMRIEPTLGVDGEAAAGIVERGYAELPRGCDGHRSFAVPVPADAPPIAALAVHAQGALTDSPMALVAILQHTAKRMATESQQPQVSVRRSLSGPGIIPGEGMRDEAGNSGLRRERMFG
jgi:DNA-binding IclR family transcriptional regulator